MSLIFLLRLYSCSEKDKFFYETSSTGCTNNLCNKPENEYKIQFQVMKQTLGDNEVDQDLRLNGRIIIS